MESALQSKDLIAQFIQISQLFINYNIADALNISELNSNKVSKFYCMDSPLKLK